MSLRLKDGVRNTTGYGALLSVRKNRSGGLGGLVVIHSLLPEWDHLSPGNYFTKDFDALAQNLRASCARTVDMSTRRALMANG
jgi:hypothetical protein